MPTDMVFAPVDGPWTKRVLPQQVQVRRYVVRVDVLNVFINAAFGQRLLIDECVVARPKIYYAI